MNYIVFDSKEDADTFLVTTDKEMGFPEPLENFRHEGGGRHCDFEVGRGLHYAVPESNEKGDKFMVPNIDVTAFKETDKIAATVALAKATVVEKLPDDWRPVDEVEGM